MPQTCGTFIFAGHNSSPSGAALATRPYCLCGGWLWIDYGAALELFELRFIPQREFATMNWLRDAAVVGHAVYGLLVHLVALRHLCLSEKLLVH